MKFDSNFAAIHGYLCSDGYVSSKDKERSIRFSNTRLELVEDFKNKFEIVFDINRRIFIKKVINKKDSYHYNGTKKEIYNYVIKFGSYYAREWYLPIAYLDKKGLSLWLRAFFDSEGWLQLQGRQTRCISAHSINHKGLLQIQEELKKTFSIPSIVKKKKGRNISVIRIYGKDNLKIFHKEIGFLHKDKNKKLKDIIDSYPIYEWIFPEEEKKLKKFIQKLMNEKITSKLFIGKPRYLRLYSNIETNVLKLSELLHNLYNIKSKIYRCVNGKGTVYFELSIQDLNSVKIAFQQDLLNSKTKKRLSLTNS